MSNFLPANMAAAGESIPECDTRVPLTGPDLRTVASIGLLLMDLASHDDDETAYLGCWLNSLFAGGACATVHLERWGEVRLAIDIIDDLQGRHRRRRAFFMSRDLNRVRGRRDLLVRRLIASGHVVDERMVNPRATTIAMRDFIRAGGRILLTPEGRLEEGGGVPRSILYGARKKADEYQRAHGAYLRLRKCFRADAQITRATRTLGVRMANGWRVLEARTS